MKQIADASENFENSRSFLTTFLLLKRFKFNHFFTIFDLEWPQMTINALETYFFEKISSKVSSWDIICLLFKNIEILPFFHFWPRVASDDHCTSFSEKLMPRASLSYLQSLREILNCDPKWVKLVIWPQTQIFY